jgi:hypothetical protein
MISVSSPGAVHWTRRTGGNRRRRSRSPRSIPISGAGVGPALTAAGVAAAPRLIVTASAIEGTAKLIASEPLGAWQAYLAFHTSTAGTPTEGVGRREVRPAPCCRASRRTRNGGSADRCDRRCAGTDGPASCTSPAISRSTQR